MDTIIVVMKNGRIVTLDVPTTEAAGTWDTFTLENERDIDTAEWRTPRKDGNGTRLRGWIGKMETTLPL